MKRIISLAFALILAVTIISGAALAEEKGWPTTELTGSAVELKPVLDKAIQMQSYAGPGRQYAFSGSFKPHRVIRATALAREGDYVLVDIEYATARRIVYFEKNSLVAADLESATLAGYPAKTKDVYYPMMYGPGENYDKITQRKISRYAKLAPDVLYERFKGDVPKILRALKDSIHWVGIDRGAAVTVFFEVDGWAYVEFTSEIGLARGWLPADRLE